MGHSTTRSRIARSSRSRTTSSVSAIAISVARSAEAGRAVSARRTSVRSGDGSLEDAAQLGERGRAERRQVGADVGVLVEGISHERSVIGSGIVGV